jgi:ComF family protein
MGKVVKGWLASLAGGLRRSLEPMACPSCGQRFGDPAEIHLCPGCLQKLLTETNLEYCQGCGRSTGPYELVEGECFDCRSKPRPFAGVIRVGPHAGVLRRLILRMKYERQVWLADGLGRLLVAAAQRAGRWAGVEAVIPVPCHWTRPWLVGSDHTHILAEAVERWGGPPLAPALRRTRWCRPQVGLSQEQRARNIRDSFGVRRHARLAGRTVALLDDVSTTGQTLRECTRVLRASGVKQVIGLILTRAEYAPAPEGVPGRAVI